VIPLFVGESNPYGSSPDFALYPSPRGCSGERLCRLVLDLAPEDYLAFSDRANLCDGRWSIAEARREAARLGAEHGRATIVLLGSKVCAAFGVPFDPFTLRSSLDHVPRSVLPRFAILPHPSGLSRAWNVPGAFDRARVTLRRARVLPVRAGGWRDFGDLSAVDPAYRRAMRCEACRIVWGGCADAFECPACGVGEPPRTEVFA
jgi:hypothetical protein